MRFFFLIILLFVSLFASAVKAEQVLDRVVAVVNGEIITMHELQLRARQEMAKFRINPNDPKAQAKIDSMIGEVLDSMIIDILIYQEAERLQVQASETDIKNELNQVMLNNKVGEEKFNQMLLAQGMSLDVIKNRIKRNITNSRLMSAMVARKVSIPKDDIAKYYNEHKNSFRKNKAVELQLLIVNPQLRISGEQVLIQLKTGKLDFNDAVKKYTVGPEPNNGGKLGLIKWDEISFEWRMLLENLSDGGYSKVFNIDNLDAILKLAKTDAGELMTFEEASPEIEQRLKAPLFEARFKEYTKQLKDKAVVDIKL